MKNGKQPINPIFNSDGFISNTELVQTKNGAIGLTKREYFAGLAMQAFIANGTHFSDICMHSVKIADELLKELEK